MDTRMDGLTARAMGLLMVLALAIGTAACGDDEPAGPVGGDVTIVPGPQAGVDQVAAPGQTFTDEFQVQVLVGGIPAGGIQVEWTPNDGTVNPATSITGANGVATTRWTLGGANSLRSDAVLFAEVARVVTVLATAPSLGESVSVALDAFSIPADHAVVEVTNNQFVPFRPGGATNIAPGTSVTWYWTSDARNHNVSPTGGSALPARSGEPRDGAYVHTQFFDAAGTYTYECEIDHGGQTHTGAVTVGP